MVLLGKRTVLLFQGYRFDLTVMSNSKGKLSALSKCF